MRRQRPAAEAQGGWRLSAQQVAPPVRLPELESGEVGWDARYREAALRVRRAFDGGLVAAVAALGLYAAPIGAGRLEDLVLRAARTGEGHAAVTLLRAHLAAGGPVAFLSRLTGGVRLLDLVESHVRRRWGASAAADLEAAEGLAELFLRLDPTDSYLYAARWRDAARRLAAVVSTAPPRRRGPAAAAELLVSVWSTWFGWAVDADGRARIAPPAEGRPVPRAVLRRVPLLPAGSVDVRIEGPEVLVEGPEGTRRGAVGEALVL